MKNLSELLKEGTINFQFHTNNPFINTLNVLKETEKAVYLEHEEYKNKIWVPKSVLIVDKIGIVTLKKWFKTKLLKSHDTYKLNALGV